MNKSFLFALVGALAVLTGGCSALMSRPVDDYLIFLDSSAAYVDELEWLSNKLEQSGLDKPEELGAIVDENLELVRQARQGFAEIDHPEARLIQLEDVLDQFSHLSQKVETWNQDCRVVNSLQHYLDALDVLFGGANEFEKLAHDNLVPEEHSKLFIYMNHYGKQHLVECLQALINGYEMEAANGPWDEEESLDLMITPKDQPDLVDDEHYLYETANQNDYDKNNFYQFYTTESLASTDKDLDEDIKVERVFTMSCSELRIDLANVFITYDVSKLLAPEVVQSLGEHLDDRFHKIDEYFRLCNQSRQT